MVNTDPSKGHAPIDHDFKVDHYKYENGVHYQPCVKASFYFKKRDDVSWEHFSKHWAHVHADLTVSSKNFGAFKCLRYSQHHGFPEMKERISNIGMKTLDFDGCSTLWFKTWDDLEKFFLTNPDPRMAGDGAHFMDPKVGVHVFAGRDVIVFGKAVPGVDDQDGVVDYPKL